MNDAVNVGAGTSGAIGYESLRDLRMDVYEETVEIVRKAYRDR